jgi:hypothetical protein
LLKSLNLSLLWIAGTVKHHEKGYDFSVKKREDRIKTTIDDMEESV